jgi:hypothetical protein
MPTKPPNTLFDPDLSKVQIRPLLDVALPLLSEILAYGLALFARCSNRPTGGDENLVILFVYRHFLEMLDSVIVQVAESVAAPAALQLRAMFEALLAIEYLTEDTSQTVSRAYAYLYKMEVNRRKFYALNDPNSAEGKQLQKFIADDPYAKEWKPLIDPKDIATRIADIDAMLAKPELVAATKEAKLAKKRVRGTPPWHSFYGGPKNIAELAQAMKRGAAYAFLYREWSERTHSVDAVDRILTHHPYGPAARGLRDATELNTTIEFAITFAIDAARCLIRYYRPGEEVAFSKWLAREVIPNRRKIPRIVVQTGSKSAKSP